MRFVPQNRRLLPGPGKTWIDVGPGFRVRILEATSGDGACSYKIEEESQWDFQEVTLDQSIILCEDSDPHRLLSGEDALYSLELFDEEGNPTVFNGGGSRQSGTSSLRTREVTLNNCSGIAHVRYTVAINPYIVKVPITLWDIPVLE